MQASHGFLTRDGTAPAALRETAASQLAAYPAVERRTVTIEHIKPGLDGFRAALSYGTTANTRRVLLATGVTGELPGIEGLAERWGLSAFNCPYCHGWEVRGQPLAVLGADEANIRLALTLTRFSDHVVLCTNGAPAPEGEHAGLLTRRGARIRTEPVARLEGPGTDLARVVFTGATAIDRRYAFTHAPARQATGLPAELGAELLDDGSVKVDDLGQTSVPGVFAAGDLARRPAMPLPGAQIAIAAAEGATAAIALDQLLFLEQLSGAPADAAGQSA